MNKAFLFSFFPIILISCVYLCADQYHDYAKDWALQHIYLSNGDLRINQQELEAIRDLIAVSAHRSKITQEAQTVALQMSIEMWHAWQNIAQTRLNPSHDRPYTVNRINTATIEEFWELIDEQEFVCQQYANVAQQVVHGDVLSTKYAKQAVSKMRAQARVFMLDALADVKKQLGDLYDIAFNKSQDVDSVIESNDDALLYKRFSISDFVLAYVPNLAINTFVQADKTHNLLSQEGWHVLEKIQHVGNQVWDAIEFSRFAFYQALLAELT
jgi:hypothetical protein